MELIARSKRLLEYARQIFGDDIVIDAFVVLDKDLSEKGKQHDAVSKIDSLQNGALHFRYDYTDIVLEFSNGKKVLFSSSEWAFIATLSDYEVYELSGCVNRIVRDGRISHMERVNIDEL